MIRHAHAAPLLALALAGIGAFAPARAVAGPFTDELSKCLVEKTTTQDKSLLVQWIFSMMAMHPDVQGLASVPVAKREDVSRRTGKLFEDLLVVRCKPEAQKAVQYEGQGVFAASFEVLGKIAAGGLFSDPTVAKESAKLGQYVDQKKLEATFAPAAVLGTPASATPAPPAPPAAQPAK